MPNTLTDYDSDKQEDEKLNSRPLDDVGVKPLSEDEQARLQELEKDFYNNDDLQDQEENAGREGQSKNSEEPKSLKESEQEAPESADKEEEDLYSPTESKKRRFRSSKKELKAQTDKPKRFLTGKKMLAGAGLLGTVIIILAVFLLLSSLKVIHFGEVMAASAYTRMNGILQERTTQNIFDASVTEGEPGITLRGKSIRDRFTFRNVDAELAKLGREGNLSFTVREGTLREVKVGARSVSLDAITKELGFGDDFASISDGLINKLNPDKVRRVMRVREVYTSRIQAAVNETLNLHPRYLRSQLFGTVADNIGFKFSGWRQKGRDFIGKSPRQADVKLKTDEATEVLGSKEGVKTGVGEIDNLSKQARDINKIKEYLEKKGKFQSFEYYAEALEKDVANAAKIQKGLSYASVAVMLGSLACITRETFQHTDDIEEQNEQQVGLIGLRVLARTSQNKEGDITPEGVGAAARQLDGAERSTRYLYDTGQYDKLSQGRSDAPKIRIAQDNKLAEAIEKITNVGGWAPEGVTDKFCDFILSPQGAIVLASAEVIVSAVIGSLTAGGGVAAGQGASRIAVQAFITSLYQATKGAVRGLASVKSVATIGGFAAYSFGLSLIVGPASGTSFTGAESNEEYYEIAAKGNDIVNNRELRSMGAGIISNDQARQVDNQYSATAKAHWNSRSLASRYFDIHNPYSLIGRVSVAIPTSFTTMASSIRSTFFRIGSLIQSPGSLLTGMFSHKVHAAVDYDPYGDTQQFGFSPELLTKMREDPSYSVVNNLDNITDSEIGELDDMIGKCFDPRKSQAAVRKDPDCSQSHFKELQDSGKKVDRYQVAFFDRQLSNLFGGNN